MTNYREMGRKTPLVPAICVAITALAGGCGDGGQVAPPPDAGSDGGSVSPPPDAGLDGSSAACPVDPVAPKSTGDRARPVLPWVWEPAGGGADGGSGSAGGCITMKSNGPPLRCRGMAAVSGSPAAPALVFGGAGRLRWDASRVAAAVPPPAVATGAQVWVEYSEDIIWVCPFCGSYQLHALQVRESEGGKILWMGREGQKLGDLAEGEVRELFGVSARVQPVCQQRFFAGCYDVQRTVLDHVLATTPEQTVRHAKLTRVTTPGGTWEVVWAATQDLAQRDPRCADGPDPANDSGFAASRIP